MHDADVVEHDHDVRRELQRIEVGEDAGLRVPVLRAVDEDQVGRFEQRAGCGSMPPGAEMSCSTCRARPLSKSDGASQVSSKVSQPSRSKVVTDAAGGNSCISASVPMPVKVPTSITVRGRSVRTSAASRR
ncbi:hypothetical protein EJO70_17725 [Variovorax sp. 553]|nr:hypothetical protein EJO70_17725 [Variovorax sp. 553]RSZ40480.1 hypothetical protein EJO71_16490 [Variovorax sp. 679]